MTNKALPFGLTDSSNEKAKTALPGMRVRWQERPWLSSKCYVAMSSVNGADMIHQFAAIQLVNGATHRPSQRALSVLATPVGGDHHGPTRVPEQFVIIAHVARCRRMAATATMDRVGYLIPFRIVLTIPTNGHEVLAIKTARFSHSKSPLSIGRRPTSGCHQGCVIRQISPLPSGLKEVEGSE
jgi:hypothetical protein